MHGSCHLLLRCLQMTDTDRSRLELAITKAVTRVEGQLSAVSSDPYALNIITYALTLAESSRASRALEMLSALAVVEGTYLLFTYL